MATGAAVSQEPAAPAQSRGARAAVFAQLTGAGRSEQVAQRLTDAILLGVLAPGDRLPSEAELAKRFGVALVTARDGLGAVREAGLVETRRGREGGSFVLATEQTPERLLQARLRGLSHVEIADLAVYFGMLAAGCAERAAELASTDEAQRLTDWLQGADFGSASDSGRNAGGFYLEIAVISQSPRLVREQIRLQAEFGPMLWLCLTDPAMRARVYAQNQRTAEAIAAHDAAGARAAVRAQISDLSVWLLAAKERLEQGATADG